MLLSNETTLGPFTAYEWLHNGHLIALVGAMALGYSAAAHQIFRRTVVPIVSALHAQYSHGRNLHRRAPMNFLLWRISISHFTHLDARITQGVIVA